MQIMVENLGTIYDIVLSNVVKNILCDIFLVHARVHVFVIYTYP